MVWNRENVEKVVVTAMITAFMGQIYISPVHGLFRLSLAVVMLSILLIHFKEVPVMVVCCIISVLIPIFRAFVHYMTYQDITFLHAVTYYYPVAIYYLLYGILFINLDIRKKLDNPFLMIISLWLCDSVPNMAEALYRSFFETFVFGNLIMNIIVVGFARSVLTYSLFYVTIYFKGRYDRKQKEKKYREMVLFISSLNSELFFLKKSMRDIENTMQMSYDLYRTLDDGPARENMLNITKNIHEIKKDYYRVVNGMEKVLSKQNDKMSMNLKEIFDIVKENSEKIISSKNSGIRLDFDHEDNFKTADFYPLISVLNNFIFNSIDAVGEDGEIHIEQKRESNHYIFRVTDNGVGIESDTMDMLFEPGFSTKYDPVTGRMSTGLGLSHVKQIVEGYFEGSVMVESTPTERRTFFEVRIPKVNLQMKG